MSEQAKIATRAATAWLAALVVCLGANDCLAQQRRVLEPRQNRMTHNAGTAIGGPAHAGAPTVGGPRFPMAPAAALPTRSPSVARQTQRPAANEGDAARTQTRAQTAHKVLPQAPRQIRGEPPQRAK